MRRSFLCHATWILCSLYFLIAHFLRFKLHIFQPTITSHYVNFVRQNDIDWSRGGLIFRWRWISPLVDREDIHNPTLTIQGRCALATNTPTPMVDRYPVEHDQHHEGTRPASNWVANNNKYNTY